MEGTERENNMSPEESPEAVLARIDERTKQIQADVADLRREADDHRSHVESRYVNCDRFQPVERIVYAATGLILVAVFGALIGIVVTH